MKRFFLSVLFTSVFIGFATAQSQFATELEDKFVVGQRVEDGAVSIYCSPDNYYDVTIDMRGVDTPFEIGVSYGKCVKQLPIMYEYRLACFLGGCIKFQKLTVDSVARRIADVLPNIPQKYVEMMNGFASQLNALPNMPAPAVMVYAANLMQDVVRPTSCSGFGVMPKASESGKTMVYRTLDWSPIPVRLVDKNTPIPDERGDLMSPLQAVIKFVYKDKDMVFFGCLGNFQCITGINTKTRIMAGILDADTEGVYNSKNSRSYAFDLHDALEEFDSVDKIATYMSDSCKYYAYSHLILLSDKKNVKVLENNCSKLGETPRRALRNCFSDLAENIPAWNFDNVIGVVNSYMLPGQPDSFRSSRNDHNSGRWQLLIDGCSRVLSVKKKFSDVDVTDIMCSYRESKPRAHSDMYRAWTQQMMLYIPKDKVVRVFFKPFDGGVFTAPDKVQKHFFELKLR